MTNIKIVKDILGSLKKLVSLIKYVADRPGHNRHYVIDDSKLKRELGWKPRHNFNKMLAGTVKWYRDNPKWVKVAVKRLKKVNPHIDI